MFHSSVTLSKSAKLCREMAVECVTDEARKALLDAAPERVIWGTDWPHVMVKGAMPNDGALADLLVDWVPERLREQVLVQNPARLYGF